MRSKVLVARRAAPPHREGRLLHAPRCEEWPPRAQPVSRRSLSPPPLSPSSLRLLSMTLGLPPGWPSRARRADRTTTARRGKHRPPQSHTRGAAARSAGRIGSGSGRASLARRRAAPVHGRAREATRRAAARLARRRGAPRSSRQRRCPRPTPDKHHACVRRSRPVAWPQPCHGTRGGRRGRAGAGCRLGSLLLTAGGGRLGSRGRAGLAAAHRADRTRGADGRSGAGGAEVGDEEARAGRDADLGRLRTLVGTGE